MPLQNRVDPFRAIHANPARGLFMGNRGGRMHDRETQTLRPGRPFVSRQWIACLIQFKNRQRKVMGDSYTELFFLDEVVALAAGHRPCAECRRADYRHYCAAICPTTAPLKAAELDLRLHGERLGSKRNLVGNPVLELPDGAMIGIGSLAYAKLGDAALPFSFSGYGNPKRWKAFEMAEKVVLTPPTSISALQNGYLPVWHPSAGA